MAKQTAWQTIGPFFHFALPWKGCADLTGDSELGARLDLTPPGHYMAVDAGRATRRDVRGERIQIEGYVRDADGAPIPDAMVEIWQANAEGRYPSAIDPRADLADDPAFEGFGRCATDAQGRYVFRTIRPGRVPGPGNSLQAPHIAVGVLARGMLKRLVTRIYFSDSAANGEDPILALVPKGRRDTLIAQRKTGGGIEYRFDIVLNGEGETVFFDF